ncbi:MAG: gliding motility-associated C-terminal domain-containing protein [Crocinitomicaceae bacterium]
MRLLKNFSLTIVLLFITSVAFSQPTNDDPCGALPISVGNSCSFIQYNNVGATGTTSPAAPSCGAYNGEDVWFAALVPPSGNLTLDAQAGTLTNINMAVYSASDCGGPFTEIGCDNNSSTNPNMPSIDLSGLTPGTVVYIRVWDTYLAPIPGPYNPLDQGTFSLCAYDLTVSTGNPSGGCGNNPAPGDDCASATPICSFDGYCGTTNAYNDNYWSQLNTAFCGSIENNSFTTFEASSTTLNLVVDVTNPGIGNCSSGIQFFLFSAANCGSGAVNGISCSSPMPVGSNNFTATGLVPGQTYYLMVDGYAGNICEYVINAGSGSGVNTGINITSGDQTVCLGTQVQLAVEGTGGLPVTWTGQNLNTNSGDTVIFTATNLGNFTIVADAAGLQSNCGSSDSVDITVVSGSNINVSASACDVDGNVVLTATGGTNYLWEPTGLVSQTSGSQVTITPTTSGTYYVYGQNGNNCIDTATIVVPACVPCTAPTITITAPNAVCEPGTVDVSGFVSATGGAIITYHATAADATNDVNALPSSVVSQLGTTTIFIRAEDPTFPTCASVDQISVTINALPTVGAGNDFTACPGENISLVANNPDGAVITWDNGVTNNVAFQAPTPGSYTYTVTANLNGCISTDQITLTVNPSPTLSLPGGSTQTICPGDNASFTAQLSGANGTQSYIWTDEQGNILSNNASASFSPTVTSWYYIVASDDCYSLLDSVKVTIGTLDVTSISVVDITSCVTLTNDGEIHITMNPPSGSYDFTVSGGTQSQGPFNNSTGDFTSLYNGTFQINIVDNVTGCMLDTSIFVGSVVGTPPSISSFNVTDVSCAGANDGEIELVGVNGSGTSLPYTIIWTPSAGAPIVDNGAITSVPTASHIQNGLYGSSWSVDIVDQLGCAFNVVIPVDEPDPINLGLTTSQPICYGQSKGSVYINATGGTTPFNFEIFDTDSTQLNTGNSNAAEQLPSGWYYCQLTDANGCFENDSIFLAQPDSISASVIVGNPLCAGDPSGWAQVIPTNGVQGTPNFSWNPLPGEISQDSAYIMAAGTYSVIMVDSAGCVWQDQFVLTDPAQIVIQTISSDPSLCRGDGIYPGSGTVSGTATGGTGTIIYQWSSSTGLGTNTNTWGNRAPGWYTLCAQDANGCYVCDSVYVDSLNPVANFSADPMQGTEPVTVTIEDMSSDRVTNTWGFISLGANGDTLSSNSNSYVIGYDSLQPPFDTTFMSGDYKICLVVSNNYECYDTLCQNIEIFPIPSIEDPNVVTPNGDGNNDTWAPITQGMAELNCTILNRWGHKVFELNSPTETWDGTNMNTGQRVSDGVYSFVYTARAQNGTEFSGQGFIHVISK